MGWPMLICFARRLIPLAAIFASGVFLFACREQKAPLPDQISLDEAADACLGLAGVTRIAADARITVRPAKLVVRWLSNRFGTPGVFQ